MKKIFSYTEKGTAQQNEDIVGIYQNVAWVIDGATPLFKKHFFSSENDVVWVVQQLNKWLPQFIDDRLSLQEILVHTVQQVQKEARGIYGKLDEVQEYELPTFTIILARIIDQQLEYYVLGDCGMLVETTGGVEYITDKRIEVFSQRNKQAIKRLQSISDRAERESRVLEALQNTRKLLNKEEGYWVGSIDGKGIPHGLSGKLAIEPENRALCFSDGYASLFELYQLIRWKDFSFEEAAIQQTIREVRRTEAEDHACTLFPRPKVSDDLTVILLENS